MGSDFRTNAIGIDFALSFVNDGLMNAIFDVRGMVGYIPQPLVIGFVLSKKQFG